MQGLVQREGPVQEYLLLLHEDSDGLDVALRQVAGVTNVANDDGLARYHISFHREQTDTNTLLHAVLTHGARVMGFQEDVRHLNQAFMDLTEPGVTDVRQAIPVAVAPSLESAP